MKGIDTEEALALLKDTSQTGLMELLKRATAAREAYAGNKIRTCSIVNARCGNCTENCAFCAQSARSRAPIRTWPMLSADEIFKAAEAAEKHGAVRYGIVTAGRKVCKGPELDTLCEAVSRIASKLRIKPCASLGILDEEVLTELKNAGLDRCHHNLEAAPSYFPVVCTTRSFQSQLDAVKAAKKVGLSVCSGGIFGIGESLEQRVELLDTVRSLEVDSVPVNFLTPIPGTLLENADNLTPQDCMRILAVARLMMPETSIRVCGGRERNMRSFQSWIFNAGADSFMTGGYLVTPGRTPEEDARMVADAGLELVRS